MTDQRVREVTEAIEMLNLQIGDRLREMTSIVEVVQAKISRRAELLAELQSLRSALPSLDETMAEIASELPTWEDQWEADELRLDEVLIHRVFDSNITT